MKVFDKEKISLTNQFDNINWIDNSGLGEECLNQKFLAIQNSGLSKNLIKANCFKLILEKSRIAGDKEDIFQDKVFGRGKLASQRAEWEREIVKLHLNEEFGKAETACSVGAFSAISDFGHTSPNSKLLLEIGIGGLLDRVNTYSSSDALTDKQKDFYESCRICLEALSLVAKRLADAIEPYDPENSAALRNISKNAPKNIYEAMQLLVLYFFMHEYIGGTRVRTLGRLDVLLYPFYKMDIENCRFTKSEIKEMLKFFFNKFSSAKVPYDLPFCLSGIDEKGEEVTSELSYLIVETYNELNIHSPKMHIRVSDKTPESFIKLVLKCVRGGNSSFVFVNDNTVIKSLLGVGIKEPDAKNYVPIGCYEPAVWGKEIGCTGNGGVNLAKAVEFSVTGGIDLKSGSKLYKGFAINSYIDFIAAVKEYIRLMTESAMNYICKIEKFYGEIGPDPMLSSMYDESVLRGVDVYEGGAEYNNTSLSFYFISSLGDSVCAVNRLVFEDKRLSFSELCDVLKNNWQGSERLRLIAQNIPEKYGNNNRTADEITHELTDFCASLVNNKPNSRGGVFKASLFTIDYFVEYGKKTMATPDGRRSGDPLSKNLCASFGQDKKGVTALISSAAKIDHTLFPNGTVLDIVLHPSAVSGEDGLDAFYAIVKTYMQKGGMAIHGNVFNPEDLRAAQKDPEKYRNLQVRVCGWNAYFVNLSKTEQDCFIMQSENSF